MLLGTSVIGMVMVVEMELVVEMPVGDENIKRGQRKIFIDLGSTGLRKRHR